MDEYSCALPIRHTTIMNDKKQNKIKLFSSKYEIAYCSTKECNKVYFMTAFVDILIMPNLLQKQSFIFNILKMEKKVVVTA